MTDPVGGAKSGESADVAIVWFRRDLRINDNPALAAACEADLVVPVFCFERGLYSGRHASPARNAFLLASLRELDEQLRAAGSRLHFGSRATPAVQIPRAGQTSAAPPHGARQSRPHGARRSPRPGSRKQRSPSTGIELVGHTGISCAEIATIETGSGRAATGSSRRSTAPGRGRGGASIAKRPRKINSPTGVPAGRPTERERPGRRRAGEADRRGVRDRARRPAGERMRAAIAGSRRLPPRPRSAPAKTRRPASPPHLHFGTISARELELGLLDRGTKGAGELRRQIAWRDFWLNVIRNFPENRTQGVRRAHARPALATRQVRDRGSRGLEAGADRRPMDRRRHAPARSPRAGCTTGCGWRSPPI